MFFTLRKINALGMLVLTILMLMPLSVLAVPQQSIPVSGQIMVADILTDVKSAQGAGAVDAVTENVTKAGDNVVTSLRIIAVVVAVIMFIFVGYGLLISPNVKTIADMKGRVGALVLAIVIAFMAEKIVGTLFNWLGITI
ncbi:TrbC/VirB2 family protein [Desulfitobacterium chlororespirans]|uniref:TrbC/VIRB2 family protein n=1 Tax=Desulfitobacterium chlororespirans DSM 11544 TaxID=1121395 RepID=A0A1M7T675_9FIRM|nr:TrbC/VirB2 family protein [Desulfitobacterium chlororespirans]SHN66251.1 TrbC/VIRB2 family protein [Desulfitobacterium chlororespirans DSM 11544]